MNKFFLMLFILIFSGTYASTIDQNTIITNDLQEILAQKSNQELVRVNIRFTDQMNLSSQLNELRQLSKKERRNIVVSALKNHAQSSQLDLMNFCKAKQPAEFKLVRQLWISNVVTAWISKEVILEIAQRNDIDRIDIDETRKLVDALPSQLVPFAPGDKNSKEITYNVLKVNADDVWALGYTGEGIIVSVIDTGVNYEHLDLTDHMWQSDDYPYHGYDFYNNDNNPMDGHGHGTHCAGTVAGDGTAGSQTGMAPNATIMACKVLADGGDGQESGVWAAIEFSVEQGADIISMSLGWAHSWNPDRQTWRITLDNALASGMVASIAAGNEGGSPSSPDDVRTPGDCPPPWLNPDQTLIGGISAVVCVGATDANDNLADFSSIGPSSWEAIDPFLDYPFNPEMGLIRPDVSAPGVDVKSCNAFNVNGYTMMSGTSMATPGVAGVMALLMSKNPGLTPEEICMTLETTSLDLGAAGKDNFYGSGRVDALVAVENTSEQGPVYEDHTFVDSNGNGELEAGENVLLTMTMFNGSDMAYSNVDVTINTESNYITITDATENYGDFAVGSAVTIEEGFAFDVAADMPGQQNIRFNVTATDGNETWTSKFDVVSWGPNISIGNLEIDDAAGNQNGRLDPGEPAVLRIELLNSGQASINDVLFNLDYSGAYLTFETTEYSIAELGSGQSEWATFNITVSEDANIGQVDMFTGLLTGGVFSSSKEFYVTIGLILEDWETGDFSSFNWGFSGNDWFITNQNPYEGEFCAQSAQISDNGSTSMDIDYEVGATGILSFYSKVSSESGYDYLRFYIDGNELGSWSGEVGWELHEYEVQPGMHTFSWQYSKDGSVASGSDATWVDYIIFPPTILPAIQMEGMKELCEGQTYTSDAVAENYVSLLWSTQGDGQFDDVSLLNASYTPGTADIANGSALLTLSATGTNGEVRKSTELYIYPVVLAAPAVPTGLPILCANPADQVYKTILTQGNTFTWLLTPAEAGTIEASADSVLVMFADDYLGEASLSVMETGFCAESAYSEPLIITVNSLPTLTMETGLEVCFGTEVSVQVDLTGTAPFTIYMDGFGEMTAEVNQLEMTWTASADSTITMSWIRDANSCLNEQVNTMSLTVNELPQVSLGNDTIICMNHSLVIDAGNPGSGFEWSTGATTQSIVADTTGLNGQTEMSFSVVVTNEFGCSSEDAKLISFQDCSGIDELSLVGNWMAYPNPSNGLMQLTIESQKNQSVMLEIVNLQGQMVYQETLQLEKSTFVHTLDLTQLAPQTYMLILRTNGAKEVKTIVIE